MGGGDLKSCSKLVQFKKLDFNALSCEEQKEGFVFHLISNDISEYSQNKLQTLAKDLNSIYPCEIKMHICDEEIFKPFPTFKDNYVAYFRFLIPQFMPSNLKTCLYLDVDMLCMQDLRELFALNLENKVAGVVLDALHWHTLKPYSKNSQALSFDFKGFYFNSGLLLLNLEEFKRQDIFKQSCDYLSNYRSAAYDQDALNAVLSQESVIVLPLEYNFLTHLYYPSLFADFIAYGFAMPYSKEEIDFAALNPIILHWAGDGKPYHNEHWRINRQNKLIGLFWWQMAFQTPIFKDELKEIFTTKAENYLIYKDFGFYVASLMIECQKSFLGFFKMPFAVFKAFKEFDFNKDYSTDKTNLDKNLAFELFFTATKAYCRKKFNSKLEQFISLPYKAFRAKKRCKKGNFRAKRQSPCHQIFAE